jgi:DNA-binding LacI/PurR family transcriptional regulator
MRAKSITIRDVAEKAQVSVSTVSRILSGAETVIAISEETRIRVLKVAQELSFRPHPGARALRGKTMNMFGLIVREIDDPFFAAMIHAIGAAAKSAGYEIVLGHAQADPNEAVRISRMMLDLRYCDGLFLVGDLHETQEDNSFLEKIGWSTPLVLFCRGSSQLVGNYPAVGVDNRSGVIRGLDYLRELGHQHIAFLGGGRLGDLNERQVAYKAYMHERLGGSREEWLLPAENNLEGGYQGMKTLLTQDIRPSAVFASDDVMAIGAYRAASEDGLRIPQDISILGFDDIKFSRYLTPALTSLRQPVEAIVSSGMDLMIRLLGEDNAAAYDQRVFIEPELIVRESCAQPAS